jgi:UDP-N-acetylmuramoyl-L-alanyl-D-glutamate--2,6-diaminopimelate ligase
MPLSRLLAGVTPVSAGLDRSIAGLASDSRRVREGYLFCATRGLRHHGLEFLPMARDRGATAVAWEPPFSGDMPGDPEPPLLAVEDLSHKLGTIAARFLGEPARDLNLIGVTGTDGKTSCAHFIAQSLGRDGVDCGLLGTLGYGVYGDLAPAAHTTPDAVTLQYWLADLRARGVSDVAMEVSSHALMQGRVAGLSFAVAVLTNLGRDHLDYHGDVASYGEAKRRLFVDNTPRYAVLNMDDAFGRSLADELRDHTQVVEYGFDAGAVAGAAPFVKGEDLALSDAGLCLGVVSSWGAGELEAALLGRFNASNLLASLAAVLASGVPFAQALEALSKVATVPGRMECFGGGARALVVVDYAHTPQSLAQALRALREHGRGRLWCVFGCGGDRDAGKRPLMGACAEANADCVVVTDDNPRSENPERIVSDILAGIEHPQRVRVVRDREAAIVDTLKAAAAGDIVLIAGKGHEDYQLIGDERIPFSDREVVRRWLEDEA